MDSVLAVILAGGRGKRMDVLCQERPKPELPFAGQYSVIDFALSNCIHSGIGNVAVLTDYRRASMANYLKSWHKVNGRHATFDVLEPKNGLYSGTADAVYRNLPYVGKHSTGPVLILAGDHVYKMDYREMLAFHRQVSADVTVAVVSVPIEQAHRFGAVLVDAEDRIVDFIEKPMLARTNLASMGLYIFNRDVLSRRLAEDARNSGSPHDFGHAVLPQSVKRGRVFTHRFKGYWRDIVTIQGYYEANMDLIREPSSLSLDGEWPILTDNKGWPSAKMVDTSSVRNSIASPGCIVGGHVENSVLSPGVQVVDKAVVKDSIIMANACLGYHSMVDHCILDEEVNIGKFSCVKLREITESTKEHITVLGKGLTLTPYTGIVSGCKVVTQRSAGCLCHHSGSSWRYSRTAESHVLRRV